MVVVETLEQESLFLLMNHLQQPQCCYVMVDDKEQLVKCEFNQLITF